MALRSHKPTIRKAEASRPAMRQPPTPSEQRITGRRLQGRRLKLWTINPYCKGCGRLTDYPNGFELDHIERLDQGGADTEANCQVLCAWTDQHGQRQGCHAEKTKSEGKFPRSYL